MVLHRHRPTCDVIGGCVTIHHIMLAAMSHQQLCLWVGCEEASADERIKWQGSLEAGEHVY